MIFFNNIHFNGELIMSDSSDEKKKSTLSDACDKIINKLSDNENIKQSKAHFLANKLEALLLLVSIVALILTLFHSHLGGILASFAIGFGFSVQTCNLFFFTVNQFKKMSFLKPISLIIQMVALFLIIPHFIIANLTGLAFHLLIDFKKHTQK